MLLVISVNGLKIMRVNPDRDTYQDKNIEGSKALTV